MADEDIRLTIFKMKALQMGYSPEELDPYIKAAQQKIDTQSAEKETETLKSNISLQKDVLGLKEAQQTPEEQGQEAAQIEIEKQRLLKEAGIGTESADQIKTKKKFQDVSSQTDLLEKNLKDAEVKGPGSGDVALLLSKITRGKLYPNVAAYDALRKSMIGPLARTISGEVGVLTDRDISRAEDLLPRINDDKALVDKKLKNLRQTIKEKGGLEQKSTSKTKTTPNKSRFTIIEVK